MLSNSQQQPQYHYITTTGDDGQPPTTIVFENYNGGVSADGNCVDVDTTIIKFETDDNQYEEYEVVRSTTAPTNDNNNELVNSSITTTAATTTTTTTNSGATLKKRPIKRTTHQHHQQVFEIVSHSDEASATLSSGGESIVLLPKPIPSVKQKRKRKTRVVADDEQGEYLEKMSVRGLDIQRYEHVIDGVSYCLVCEKNDIYKTFKNKYSFQRHAYLFHEGVNRKIFACPICNKEFSRPDKMKMHKKDKHGDMPVPDSTNGAGAETTATPTAKRARNTGAVRPPRARKRPSSSSNDTICSLPGGNASAAKSKRLAQIDSVLDEVQNADSNNSHKALVTTTTTNNSNQNMLHETSAPTQTQQQQQQQQQQQLPSIDLSGMILPGGAQLALANPGATPSGILQQHQRVGAPNGSNGPTLIYSNQIELPQALLQQQLHGQSQIMIQDQAGNLVPLQSLTTTLDASGQTIYTTRQQHQQQLLQQHHLQDGSTLVVNQQPQQQQQQQQQQSLLTLAPHQLKLEPHEQQQQQQQQQQHFDLENVAYLSATAATPAPTEHQVIGTVQSYQILTPDGLQSYQAAASGIKLEPSELSELCPYTTTSTPQYAFSTHADPLLQQHHLHHQHHHHQQQQQQQQQSAAHLQQHGGAVVQQQQQQQQQHHQQQQHQQHPQFMEVKNELLIKDAYTLDASSMYHLPFSPTSMINAVNDVNGSSLLETKEIR